MDELTQLIESAKADFAAATQPAALEDAKARYLGKSGAVTMLMKGLGALAPEERKERGKAINAVKQAIDAALTARREALANAELEKKLATEAVDVTLPGRVVPAGGVHPVIRTWMRVEEIFRSIGFDVADGPEIESDWFSFTALNNPPNHPARSMQDTFYVRDLSGERSNVRGESDVLLRTQTSGVQVHVMEDQDLPIYIIAPGKVYRRDVADPSHLPQFTQCEGLVVDKNITFGDLKGTLEYFCKQMFGPDRKTRFRAHFFPFTEPSAEVDVSCNICHGKGCNICKGTGWLEILGCGMVDPNVLEASGIDSKKYSGFAFGMGIERIAMLKWQVNDLRHYFENDMRFLREFSSCVEV